MAAKAANGEQMVKLCLGSITLMTGRYLDDITLVKLQRGSLGLFCESARPHHHCWHPAAAHNILSCKLEGQ
jgi:hypothetical protein